jgi:hypothetical protein
VQLSSGINRASIPALKHVLTHQRTVFVNLFKLLIDRKAIAASEESLSEALECLTDVHAIYMADDELRTNDCVGLFHAFVYFCVTDSTEGHLKPFRHWVKGNHLTALKSIDARL